MPGDFKSIAAKIVSNPLGKSVEKTSGERWDLVPTNLISDVKDPQKIPEHLLNYLAHEWSVDVWDESWPIEKKRAVIAAAPEDHRRKGTESGLRRYAAHAGGTIRKIITAPQGVYPVAEWTDAERASYLAQLDQVRIYRFYPVDVKATGVFAGASYWGASYFSQEAGWNGYRKRAVLRHPNGTEVELDTVFQERVTVGGLSTQLDKIVIPQDRSAGFYAGASAWGVDYFDPDDQEARTYQISTPVEYNYGYGRQQFGLLNPSGFNANLEPELVYEEGGPDHASIWAGASAWGNSYWMPNEAWRAIYERYYIPNAELAASGARQGSYFGDAWFGWAPFTAQVAVRSTEVRPGIGAETMWGGFFRSPDVEKFNQLVDAIHASKALRDTIYVTTSTYRFPRLGDRMLLDSAVALGDMISDR